MATSVELRQRRASLWEEAKSLHNLADKEKRQLTAEEQEQWDRINDEIDSLKVTIERMERMATIDAEMEEVSKPVTQRVQPEGHTLDGFGTDPDDENESKLPDSKEYRKAFLNYLRRGMVGLLPDQRAILQPFYGGSNINLRVSQTTGAGGALVPEVFYRKLVEAMQAWGGMRQANTTKFSTDSGAPMPIPLVDDTFVEGELLAEGSATSLDGTDPAFGSKDLGAYMYDSKIVRLSIQLIQDSAFNLETWLATALGRRIGRITNRHFTTGDGNGQPEGIVNFAGAGVTDASINLDYFDLIALEHSIDPAYRNNSAQWMFHDTTLAVLKQVKAVEDGRPLWLPGLAVNAPDTLLGYRYIINQHMPQAEAEAKAILFGDFSYYFIRDVQDLRVIRLDEKFAEYLQVGFLAFMRCDGVFATPTAISGGSEQGANESAPVKYLQFGDESA